MVSLRLSPVIPYTYMLEWFGKEGYVIMSDSKGDHDQSFLCVLHGERHPNFGGCPLLCDYLTIICMNEAK